MGAGVGCGVLLETPLAVGVAGGVLLTASASPTLQAPAKNAATTKLGEIFRALFHAIFICRFLLFPDFFFSPLKKRGSLS
jgi:hypothetical protein